MPDIACVYCGASNSFKEREGVCRFCEGYVANIPPHELNMTNAERQSILQAREMVENGNYEGACKLVDSTSGSKDPFVNYVAGIIYKYCSDFYYFSIDYALKGFMEQNAENRERSLKLEGLSRERFYRVVYEVEKAPEPKSEPLVYLELVSLVKLGRLAEAKAMLEKLDKKGKAYAYANMLCQVEANDKQAEKAIRPLLEKEANASYYLAKYFAKNGKLGKAKQILAKFKKLVPNALIALPLEKRIQEYESNLE